MSCFHHDSRGLLVAVALVLLGGGWTVARAEEEGYRSLFNGKDLTDWDGNPELWSVQDGALTGISDGTLKQNQFVSWTGGNVENFELKLEFRMEGNSNSGVQYRSQRMPTVGPWVVGGYQADIHPAAKYTAMLYEERGRGIVAERGQKVSIQKDGKKEITALPGTFEKVDLTKWHELVVRCEGNHLVHQLDGVTVVDVTDLQEPGRDLAGIIAFQLHVGPPMKAQFRNIRLKSLPPGKAQSSIGPDKETGRFRTPEGFRVERLVGVSGQTPACWSALCVDPRGRLIAADDEGGLFRVSPAGLFGAEKTRIEKIAVPVGRCRQLLWAFESLYVAADQPQGKGTDLYRIRDTNGDDQLDAVELLRTLSGTTEQSSCELALSAKQDSIDIICRHGTALPKVDVSHVPAVWDEDGLLPRLHGNGAFQGVPAPGGFVVRMTPDGQRLELLAVGFSNPGAAVRHPDGELLLCETDSLPDAGSPWFRPSRLCHVLSGADFGWRSGSAKHPEYLPEIARSVVHLPVQEPAGACFGTDAKFPAHYQQALFLCDAKQGKISAVHLKPQGATYLGEIETFLTTPNLPLGDVLINPADGAMYLIVEGVEADAGLYRLSSTATSRDVAENRLQVSSPSAERIALQRLQKLHGPDHQQAVEIAWPYLSHPDPTVRAAARTAIEFRPAEEWASRAMNEEDVQAKLESLLALCRLQVRDGKKPGIAIDSPAPDWESFLGNSLGARGMIQIGILTSLSGVNWTEFNFEQRMLGLRIVQLSLLRFGQPDTFVRDALLDSLGDSLPAKRIETNSQLLEILVYLQSPQAAAQGMELLQAAESVDEQILYATSLAFLREGWSQDLRTAFFQWCHDTARKPLSGDASECVAELRKQALSGLSEQDRQVVLKAVETSTRR